MQSVDNTKAFIPDSKTAVTFELQFQYTLIAYFVLPHTQCFPISNSFPLSFPYIRPVANYTFLSVLQLPVRVLILGISRTRAYYTEK
jgi:hypothetical protein